MGDDIVDFDVWLTEVAARAGYSGHGSTAELARVAGVDPGQMSRFLNGKAVPSSGNLPGLADALGVEIDEMARRIAGVEVRRIKADKLTPEQAIAALGINDPKDQAAVMAVIERLRARPAATPKPKRSPKSKASSETPAEEATRGIGWLPNQDPPTPPEGGAERWFAPKPTEDEE